jgi:hypothetical protein
MRIRTIVPIVGIMITAITACTGDVIAPANTIVADEAGNSHDAVKFWESGASVYWNSVARDLVVQYRSSPFAALRSYALVSHAQYSAIVEAQNAQGQVHPSVVAAAARASAVTLKYLYPAEETALNNLVAAEFARPGWPGGQNTDIAAGEAIGQSVGDQIVTAAQADRFFAAWPGTVPTGPGLWFSASTPPAPPVGPMFGLAQTYYLTSPDQFRPPPPPVFGSPEFLAALAEAKQISDTRTAQQTANAQFWAFGAGTVTPPGYWNIQAATLAAQYHLNELKTAHVLAVMNMTGFDALIACHDAKFTYWLLRPTQADPSITVAVPLPNFPSYPSNHACISGAQAKVLAAFFPAESEHLTALANAAAHSRLEGGIHYRFDNETGLRLGREVAGFALSVDAQ